MGRPVQQRGRGARRQPNPNQREFTEGTLVVDVTRADTRELVWRGVYHDTDDEPATVRDRYGRHRFGQSVLLARRLIEAGVSAVDIIDLEYPAWHTPDDTLEAISPKGLQVVGDVILTALPMLEARFR